MQRKHEDRILQLQTELNEEIESNKNKIEICTNCAEKQQECRKLKSVVADVLCCVSFSFFLFVL